MWDASGGGLRRGEFGAFVGRAGAGLADADFDAARVAADRLKRESGRRVYGTPVRRRRGDAMLTERRNHPTTTPLRVNGEERRHGYGEATDFLTELERNKQRAWLEERYQYKNVMSSSIERERSLRQVRELEQARAGYSAGRVHLPPGRSPKEFTTTSPRNVSGSVASLYMTSGGRRTPDRLSELSASPQKLFASTSNRQEDSSSDDTEGEQEQEEDFQVDGQPREQRIGILENQLVTAMVQHSKTIDEFDDKTRDLQEDNSRLHVRVRELEKELDVADEIRREKEKLSDLLQFKVQQLEGTVKKEEAEMARLREMMSRSSEELSMKEIRSKEYETKWLEKELKVTGLLKQLEEGEKQVEIAQKELAEREETYIRQTTLLEQEIHALTDELDAARKARDTTRVNSERRVNDVENSFQGQLDVLERRKTQLEKTVETLNAQIEQMQRTHRGELECARGSNVINANEVKEQYSKLLQEKDRHIVTLQDKLSTQSAEFLAQVDDAKSKSSTQVAHLESKIAALNAELDSLRLQGNHRVEREQVVYQERLLKIDALLQSEKEKVRLLELNLSSDKNKHGEQLRQAEERYAEVLAQVQAGGEKLRLLEHNSSLEKEKYEDQLLQAEKRAAESYTKLFAEVQSEGKKARLLEHNLSSDKKYYEEQIEKAVDGQNELLSQVESEREKVRSLELKLSSYRNKYEEQLALAKSLETQVQFEKEKARSLELKSSSENNNYEEQLRKSQERYSDMLESARKEHEIKELQLNKSLENLTTLLQATNTELEEKSSKCTTLASNIDSLLHEKHELTRRVATLEKEALHAEEDLNNKVEWEKQILLGKEEALQAEMEQLKSSSAAEIGDKVHEIQKLTQDMERISQQLSTEQLAREELETNTKKLLETIRLASERLNEQETRVEMLTRSEEELTQNMSMLNQDLVLALEEKGKAEEVARGVGKMTTENKDLKQEVAKYSELLYFAKRERAEQVSQLEQTLRSVEKKNTMLVSAEKVLLERVDVLSKELSLAHDANTEQERTIETIKSQCASTDEYHIENTKLKEELEKSRTLLIAERDSYEAELENIRSSLEGEVCREKQQRETAVSKLEMALNTELERNKLIQANCDKMEKKRELNDYIFSRAIASLKKEALRARCFQALKISMLERISRDRDSLRTSNAELRTNELKLKSVLQAQLEKSTLDLETKDKTIANMKETNKQTELILADVKHKLEDTMEQNTLVQQRLGTSFRRESELETLLKEANLEQKGIMARNPTQQSSAVKTIVFMLLALLAAVYFGDPYLLARLPRNTTIIPT